MATDSERREVAARLRGLRPGTCFDDVYEALGAYGPSPYESRGLSATGLARRLADLIEPSCDRDALLALADEIEDNDVTYCVSTQCVLDIYASRIREALGVTS